MKRVIETAAIERGSAAGLMFRGLFYLRLLAEVGRELQAGDIATVVAHDEDWVDGVEVDVR